MEEAEKVKPLTEKMKLKFDLVPNSVTKFEDSKLKIKNCPGEWYKGYFKNGLYDGFGERKAKGGKRFRGDFKEGEEWGKGWLLCKNGDSYKGHFIRGQKSGFGTFTWKITGESYTGEWLNDLKHGKGAYRNEKTGDK